MPTERKAYILAQGGILFHKEEGEKGARTGGEEKFWEIRKQ